jgi:hypothetical protein
VIFLSGFRCLYNFTYDACHAVRNEIDVFDRPGPRVWVRKFRVVVRIGLARDRLRIALGLE